jgi:CheY-like chemotaxis protein
MRAAAERGAKLTDQLLTFSRRQRLEPRVLDLNATVSSMRDLLQSTMGGTIQINTRLARRISPALVDPTQLELAVLNLAINARDAMEIGGTLTVATANVTLGPPQHPEEPPAGEYVEICVGDTGFGMPPDVREKVFEPFFTTKEVGKGSGLGLSQVLGFAKQSGGGVRIESEPGAGTSVRIYMPRSDGIPQPARTAPASISVPEAHNCTILLVDDDNAVREVTAEMLRDLGYAVVEAGSGGVALDLIEKHPAIALALLDFAMPGMSGADVARGIRDKRPELPILFVTGFADRSTLTPIGEAQIISKPFVPEELAERLRLALTNPP